jgi:hypothetical protein
VQIADSDFGPDNFRSIGGIADLIVRLKTPEKAAS